MIACREMRLWFQHHRLRPARRPGPTTGARTYAPRVRDMETIDSRAAIGGGSSSYGLGQRWAAGRGGCAAG
jgi:hypothetical protein